MFSFWARADVLGSPDLQTASFFFFFVSHTVKRKNNFGFRVIINIMSLRKSGGENKNNI